jgi:uncharacterized membrane protein YeaQ/YmgE (transglycosylase-associated protein family)
MRLKRSSALDMRHMIGSHALPMGGRTDSRAIDGVHGHAMSRAPVKRCGLARPKLGCARTAEWGLPPIARGPTSRRPLARSNEARVDVAPDSRIVKEAKVGFAAWVVLGVVAGWTAANFRDGSGPVRLAGALLTGVAGAVVGGALASLLGIGSASMFFSLGAWAAALGGAAVALATGAIARGPRLGRSRPAP